MGLVIYQTSRSQTYQTSTDSPFHIDAHVLISNDSKMGELEFHGPGNISDFKISDLSDYLRLKVSLLMCLCCSLSYYQSLGILRIKNRVAEKMGTLKFSVSGIHFLPPFLSTHLVTMFLSISTTSDILKQS